MTARLFYFNLDAFVDCNIFIHIEMAKDDVSTKV